MWSFFVDITLLWLQFGELRNIRKTLSRKYSPSGYSSQSSQQSQPYKIENYSIRVVCHSVSAVFINHIHIVCPCVGWVRGERARRRVLTTFISEKTKIHFSESGCWADSRWRSCCACLPAVRLAAALSSFPDAPTIKVTEERENEGQVCTATGKLRVKRSALWVVGLEISVQFK